MTTSTVGSPFTAVGAATTIATVPTTAASADEPRVGRMPRGLPRHAAQPRSERRGANVQAAWVQPRSERPIEEERAEVERGCDRGAREARKPRRYTRRVMGLMSKLLHAGEGRKLKALQSLVPEVAAYEAEMQARSDAELRAMTAEFRRRLDQVGPDPVADQRRAASTPSTSSSPRPSRSCARPACARSGSVTSTSRSWAVPRCTSAGSRR